MSKKVAMAGMFTALAMIFSYVEVLIPISLGIPGIKLGLANLVVVVALYTMGAPMALAVSMIRILLVSVTFGNLAAMLYSLAGGLLSFGGMILLKKYQNFRLSVSVWPEVFSIMRDSWQLPWRWWKIYTFCHTCHY